MTKRECAIIMAQTGICMLKRKDIQYYYKYLEELFNRPIQTLEILPLESEIKERSFFDFINLCEEATD